MFADKEGSHKFMEKLMSVYLDHLSVKTNLENYKSIFNFFQKLLPEHIFIHGEELEGENPWAGFFLYFDGGFFIEFSDPNICKKSKNIGMSFTCVNDFRESFIDVMTQNTRSKFERISLPKEDPILEICSIDDGEMLSARASVYSDTWYREWGQEISKLSLLSPFGRIVKILINTTNQNKEAIGNNFSWLDPNIANDGHKFIPISGGECSLEMKYDSTADSQFIEVEFELDEEISHIPQSDFFEFQINEKLGRMRVKL